MSDKSSSQADRGGTFDVFLSAVTSEFQSERGQLREWLRKKSVHVVEQSDFIQGGGTLWESLKERIVGCPAIVCLIGAQAGAPALPAEVPAGSPTRSYTQWEFWLAWGEKPWSPPRRKRVLVYFPADLEQRFAAAEAAAQDDPAAVARLVAQREHIAGVKATGIHYESFTDPDHLIKLCLAQDLLCQRARKWTLGLAAALLVLAGMAWAIGTQLQKIDRKVTTLVDYGKPERQLVGDFLEVYAGEAKMAQGKGEELRFDYAVETLAKIKKLTPEKLRDGIALGATLIQRDPEATLVARARAAFARKAFASAYDLARQAAEQQVADLAKAGAESASQLAQLAATWMLAGHAARELVKYPEAATAFEIALQLTDKTADPLRWANTATWLAEGHLALADYGKAEPLQRDVLSLREAILGAGHPEVATALNNLAGLLARTNRLAEAEPLYRRALLIAEKSAESDPARVATVLSDLALLMGATSRSAEAEPLARRALALDEKALGPAHPRVAIDLNNLGTLLYGMNRLDEAEPLFRRALTILGESLGFDHPQVAMARNNLAEFLRTTFRLVDAEPQYRQALASYEKTLGSDHPDVAMSLNNLAGFLASTERMAEAEPLYRRALAIHEKSLGPDHPNVALCLHNLARVLQATDRLADAEPLFRRAVVILAAFQKKTGHEHPNFQACVRNYELALVVLDRPNVAETVAAAAAGE